MVNTEWYTQARVDELVREAKANGLREAADTFEWAGDDEDYMAFRKWLYERADKIDGGR